jgi:hypothetical protein
MTHYTVDFVTALSLESCIERLEKDEFPLPSNGMLAGITQQILITGPRHFTLERSYSGALRPIRFQGDLDPAPDSHGTHVHGEVTHDAENQIWLEGLMIFIVFFLMAVVLVLRLRLDGLLISIGMAFLLLTVFSMRWRALRAATADTVLWLRRKLYVTADQIR